MTGAAGGRALAAGTLAALVTLGALAAVPAAGHGVNSATLDPQVSADGTVYVETAFLETDGWVALRDASGAFVGHARVRQGSRVVTDIGVSVPADAWPAEGEGPLWVRATTYGEDGDGAFDPDADRKLVQFGGPPDPVPVARGGDATRVLAAGADPLVVDEGRLTVREVALPADGHLVVRNATGDGTGRTLGSRALGRGTHRNVTVALAEPPGTGTTVSIALHRGDGDGTFDGDEPPDRVGNRTVATRVTVAPPGAGDGPAVVTATPAGGGDSGDGEDTPDGIGAVLAAAAVTGLLGIVVGVAGIAGARRGWW